MTSDSLPEHAFLGDYKIESILGSGGFGITYLAFDCRLKSKVAIKEYFPAGMAKRNTDFSVATLPGSVDGGYEWGLEKFVQEAATLARLQHANIVGVNRLFKANGTAYMILDFVDGQSLKQWLNSLGRKPTQSELDHVMFPLLAALDIVHFQDLLHRDIAPKNIMLSTSFVPVLIDFGAARQMVAKKSQTFATLLTPGYAPFEQYVATGGKQGPWTDIYSLAASFYEAITGKRPPEAPDRTVFDKCQPIAECGKGDYRKSFLEAIDWGLRPLPNDRPQSVEEWRQALNEGVLEDDGIGNQRDMSQVWRNVERIFRRQ